MISKIFFGLTILLAIACICILSAGVGSYLTYSRMVPIVEERIVRDVNWCLVDAGIKRYRVRTDNLGTVKLVVKGKGDAYVRSKAEQAMQSAEALR